MQDGRLDATINGQQMLPAQHLAAQYMQLARLDMQDGRLDAGINGQMLSAFNPLPPQQPVQPPLQPPLQRLRFGGGVPQSAPNTATQQPPTLSTDQFFGKTPGLTTQMTPGQITTQLNPALQHTQPAANPLGHLQPVTGSPQPQQASSNPMQPLIQMLLTALMSMMGTSSQNNQRHGGHIA